MKLKNFKWEIKKEKLYEAQYSSTGWNHKKNFTISMGEKEQGGDSIFKAAVRRVKTRDNFNEKQC